MEMSNNNIIHTSNDFYKKIYNVKIFLVICTRYILHPLQYLFASALLLLHALISAHTIDKKRIFI